MEQTTTTPNPQQETQSSNQQELSSGVIRKNQGLTDSIKYIIPTSGLSKIKDPEAREVYLKDKIKTVTRDAKKQGDLEKTTLEFEGDNPIAFREETNKLCKKSMNI